MSLQEEVAPPATNYARTDDDVVVIPDPPTGWVGWAMFAGAMMTMIGIFQGIAGFIALFNDAFYVVAKSGLAISVDYTAWGWAHIVLGILLIGAGVSVMRGNMYGRIVGVFLAMLSAVVNMLFLPAYPVWGVIMITVDVLVIYALTAHGRELKTS